MKLFVLVLILTALAPIGINAQPAAPQQPLSCQQLHRETERCEAGMRSCNQRRVARLETRCQRDAKRHG
jgi:hypothetical protein